LKSLRVILIVDARMPTPFKTEVAPYHILVAIGAQICSSLGI
jgi:hypothetical protein